MGGSARSVIHDIKVRFLQLSLMLLEVYIDRGNLVA
jgi:hypothetical protein